MGIPSVRSVQPSIHPTQNESIANTRFGQPIPIYQTQLAVDGRDLLILSAPLRQLLMVTIRVNHTSVLVRLP